MELAVQIKASESLCVLVSISYLSTYLQVKARFRWQQGDSKVVELNEISSTLWSCQDRNWSSYRPDSAKLVKFTILPLSIHVFHAKKNHLRLSNRSNRSTPSPFAVKTWESWDFRKIQHKLLSSRHKLSLSLSWPPSHFFFGLFAAVKPTQSPRTNSYTFLLTLVVI